MAWYSLPGVRSLHTSGPVRTDEVRQGREPLLERRVPFRLVWHGPVELEVTTLLPQSTDTSGEGARSFIGRSDGVSLLAATLEQTTQATYSLPGAPSLIRDAEELVALYRTMINFYRELLERSLATVLFWQNNMPRLFVTARGHGYKRMTPEPCKKPRSTCTMLYSKFYGQEPIRIFPTHARRIYYWLQERDLDLDTFVQFIESLQ